MARRVAGACGLARGERVVEVGPGLGALTLGLVEAGGQVVAVERDPRLAQALVQVLRRWAPSAEGRQPAWVVAADVLTLDLGRLLTGQGPGSRPQHGGRPGMVASNLPYGITSPFLLQLVRTRGWRRAVLMVQKEVGERLAARPGEAAYGSLSVAVQARCRIQRLFDVSRRCFVPPPEVDSVVVALQPLASPLPVELDGALERLLRAGFGQRRKTLKNALASLYADLARTGSDAAGAVPSALELLHACGIDPGRRAETLSPEEFLRLAAVLSQRQRPCPGEA